MSKDRPWNRPQPTQVPDLPQTEEAIGVFRYKGADVLSMTDAQVRAFCLEKARQYLHQAQIKAVDTLGGRDLELATQYATIAQAFRQEEPGDDPAS